MGVSEKHTLSTCLRSHSKEGKKAKAAIVCPERIIISSLAQWGAPAESALRLKFSQIECQEDYNPGQGPQD